MSSWQSALAEQPSSSQHFVSLTSYGNLVNCTALSCHLDSACACASLFSTIFWLRLIASVPAADNSVSAWEGYREVKCRFNRYSVPSFIFPFTAVCQWGGTWFTGKGGVFFRYETTIRLCWDNKRLVGCYPISTTMLFGSVFTRLYTILNRKLTHTVCIFCHDTQRCYTDQKIQFLFSFQTYQICHLKQNTGCWSGALTKSELKNMQPFPPESSQQSARGKTMDFHTLGT